MLILGTRDYTKIHPFNVHPDFSRVLSEFFFRVASAHSFKVASLKKDGFHCKSEKNQVSTLKKSGRGGTLEKSGCTL